MNYLFISKNYLFNKIAIIIDSIEISKNKSQINNFKIKL
jgi:hypothetical protein